MSGRKLKMGFFKVLGALDDFSQLIFLWPEVKIKLDKVFEENKDDQILVEFYDTAQRLARRFKRKKS